MRAHLRTKHPDLFKMLIDMDEVKQISKDEQTQLLRNVERIVPKSMSKKNPLRPQKNVRLSEDNLKYLRKTICDSWKTK